MQSVQVEAQAQQVALHHLQVLQVQLEAMQVTLAVMLAWLDLLECLAVMVVRAEAHQALAAAQVAQARLRLNTGVTNAICNH
jgi:hypothetical protein